MLEPREGLQKSVAEIFGAYRGWNGTELERRRESDSAIQIEQTIDQIVNSSASTKKKRQSESSVVRL